MHRFPDRRVSISKPGFIGINTEKVTTLPVAVVKTGLTFAATRKDTIATDTNKKNLIYTTGATRKVTTATFNDAITWDTTTPYYDASDTTVNNKGYTFDGDTVINATDLTFTGTTNTNPMGQSTVLIANATNISGDHITQPDTGIGTVTVADYTDTKGIIFDATATGSVVVEDSAVKYKVNTVKMSSKNAVIIYLVLVFIISDSSFLILHPTFRKYL